MSSEASSLRALDVISALTMKLLFVCTGNTCRSPMAEAIARRLAADRGLTDLEVTSAGTGAADGGPVSDGAMLVGLEHGVDLNAHRSRTLTPELVREADLILAMSPAHVDRILAMGGEGRTELLTTFSSRGAVQRGVSDPFGSDLEVYRETWAELELEIARALERLAEREGR